MPNEENDNKLPSRVPAGKRGAEGNIYVEHFNYNPNSISELRRLAETNPDLAEKIISAQDGVSKRDAISEWVGFGAATLVALTAIIGFVTIVVSLGWWQSIVFVAVLLAVSHVLRTILTGQWSETSWLGSIFKTNNVPPEKDE